MFLQVVKMSFNGVWLDRILFAVYFHYKWWYKEQILTHNLENVFFFLYDILERSSYLLCLGLGSLNKMDLPLFRHDIVL